MKFMLIFWACSILNNQCGKPLQDPSLYDTHKQCIIKGYEQSISVINSMDTLMVNENKLYFAFSCQELQTA